MRILIISVNHQIQPAQILSMSTNGKLEAFEREQKETFGSFVKSKILERGVQFIAEEARHGHETVIQRLRALNNWRYANIEMTPVERTARNIPPGYHEDQSLPEAEKARCHREREEYMVERILGEVGDAESILIICGRIHTTPFADRFRELGHSVETTDLQDENWYIEDWNQHMIDF